MMLRYIGILSIGLGVHTVAMGEGSADHGLALFIQNCGACHSIESNRHKVGPSLAGIFGRDAGAVEGFGYSQGLASQEFTWNDATLHEYLTTPTQSGGGDQLLHSVHMHFEGISSKSADDLIAFLKTLTKSDVNAL